MLQFVTSMVEIGRNWSEKEASKDDEDTNQAREEIYEEVEV